MSKIKTDIFRLLLMAIEQIKKEIGGDPEIVIKNELIQFRIWSRGACFASSITKKNIISHKIPELLITVATSSIIYRYREFEEALNE